MKLQVGKCRLCSASGLSPCTQYLKIPPQQKHWTSSLRPKKKKPALAKSSEVTGTSAGQFRKVRSLSPSSRIWGFSRSRSKVLLSSVILQHVGFSLCLRPVPVVPFAVHSGAHTEGERRTTAEITWSGAGGFCAAAYRWWLSRKSSSCQNVCSLILEWMPAWTGRLPRPLGEKNGKSIQDFTAT